VQLSATDMSTEAKSSAAKRTPEAREASSERMRQYYADHPEALAAWLASAHTPEVWAKMRTPEARKRVSDRSTLFFEDPVNRLVQSADQRRYLATDYETGGARVPGGWRDAHLRAHIAYVEEHRECMVGHPECLDLIAEELA
ncbi:hypothetical protein LCGC14_2816010, partial [marine sediment metagenome]